MDYNRIVVQWKEFEVPKAHPRSASIELESDFIKSITGPRRAGKTYYCFQLIQQLIDQGISKENILYINFEDEKLLGSTADDLSGLWETYYELSKINKEQKIYLFLDEIQNVINWDAWIRRIYDTEKNLQIVITGSSSKLLSKKLSTKLRGRVINTEIYPLSLKELLDWKNITYDSKTISYSKKRFEIKKLFSSYLINGGYPALLLQNVDNVEVLQNYFEVMMFRDIVERHSVKEIKKLKVLANLLFESTTKDISYNKLANKLKSLGYSISKNTIIEYIAYFEDAYLFFQNLKYEYSITKQLGAIKKIYCIDNGLLNAVSFKFSEDIGKLMENLVYIELKRKNKTIYYHKKNHECDFLITEKNKVTMAIQVTRTLNDDNYKREMSGLLEALKTHNLKKGLIVTYDQEEEIIKGKNTIKIIPLWKWLLERK